MVDKRKVLQVIENNRPPTYASEEGVEVGEESITRALVAINNLMVVQTELLLDIWQDLG